MSPLYARSRRWLRLGAALLTIFPGAALAQGALDPGAVEALSAELRADQEAHLWRVGAWGAANVAGGVALLALSDREGDAFRHGLGMQSAAWGAVNVGIAAVGLARGTGGTTGAWADALGAENGYADILLVNLGLNVGYAAVGGTLLAVAGRGVSNPSAWRGHGTALLLQGAGLFVLDGVAYLASRTRLDALVELAAAGAVAVGPGSLYVVIGL